MNYFITQLIKDLFRLQLFWLLLFNVNSGVCFGNSKMSSSPKDTLSFHTKDILFDTDRYKIENEYKLVLDKLIKNIDSMHIIAIELYAHTDSRASESYNMALSEKRALEIKKYLNLYINNIDIRYKAFGERFPQQKNTTLEAMALNRRVEIIVRHISNKTLSAIDIKNDTIIDGRKVKKPTKNCRAFFTGLLLNDHYERQWFSEVYKVDEYSEYVGEGKYIKNINAFPKAVASTFDGIAIAKGTRVVIYSKENLQGDVLLDESGPALINNFTFKGQLTHKGTHIDSVITKDLTGSEGDLNLLFPPSCRKYSATNMNLWSNGSIEVICED